MKRLQLISNHLAELLITVQVLPEKVAIVTLNRPGKLNALSNELMREFNIALSKLDSDPSVHVIVLAGAGKAFCVGADVSTFQTVTPGSVAITNPIELWFEVLPKLKKPIIAAVHGLALGGGCEIAMMCDIIIAEKTAKFGQPEIKLGVIPGAGGTQRLTKTIGKYKTMEMVLLGEPITASEAKCLGLISRIAEKHALDDAIEMAKKIAKYSLPVVCICKKAVNFSLETTLSAGLTGELNFFNQCMALKDKEEGIAALLEKRAPKFTNS